MRNNSKFWESRPLKKDMLDYASKDVFYLEKLFNIFSTSFKERQLDKIFEESQMCFPYSFLNMHVQKLNRKKLKEDSEKKVEIYGLLR